MRICIPAEGKKGWGENVSQHFGRAPAFALIDSETKNMEFFENSSEHFGGVGKPPEIIAAAGADIVLTSGMGPRAMQMLAEAGLQVYCGATGTIKETFEAYNEGKLALATSELACKDHKH